MTHYEIRRALTVKDLDGARTVVLHTAEVDLGYGYQPQWHWDLDRPVAGGCGRALM